MTRTEDSIEAEDVVVRSLFATADETPTIRPL
jgi:hypothetical protein